ncbi:hypothetical protein SNUCP2_01980 [Clostridium perfringens A]|uniref:Uncharacterized protein n=1 Tax=Clostridium perfringens F262 TaxID=883064 RepID=A0AAV3FGV0_CLOPF|nr:hypothetical protein HA1_00663 [Clostridium perfringens F262]
MKLIASVNIINSIIFFIQLKQNIFYIYYLFLRKKFKKKIKSIILKDDRYSLLKYL